MSLQDLTERSGRLINGAGQRIAEIRSGAEGRELTPDEEAEVSHLERAAQQAEAARAAGSRGSREQGYGLLLPVEAQFPQLADPSNDSAQGDASTSPAQQSARATVAPFQTLPAPEVQPSSIQLNFSAGARQLKQQLGQVIKEAGATIAGVEKAIDGAFDSRLLVEPFVQIGKAAHKLAGKLDTADGRKAADSLIKEAKGLGLNVDFDDDAVQNVARVIVLSSVLNDAALGFEGSIAGLAISTNLQPKPEYH